MIALWVNDQKLTGDFYVQNEDVIQPGPHAPFYLRYGHSLDAISIASYGYELMLLAGGYAPQPINDQWMSEDGNNWVYDIYIKLHTSIDLTKISQKRL